MQVVAVSSYGASPVLMDVPDPRPGFGQILIKVHAAGMNPMDRSIAAGAWKSRFDATFPFIMGVDVAGVVEAVGTGATRFMPGHEAFGQLIVAPLGSAGTYAERVAAPEGANLARVPDGMDATTAAALPTAGGTALDIAEHLELVGGKTVMLIVGAAGGVGSFLTQLAASAGATVITVASAGEAGRLRGYGAAENVDRAAVSIAEAVRAAHPQGVDVLVDLASDAEGFTALASLVRGGGTALTTRYAADVDALATAGVTGTNFRVGMTPQLLERLADEITSGRVAPPPIRTVGLADVPGLLAKTGDSPGGKTVITLS